MEKFSNLDMLKETAYLINHFSEIKEDISFEVGTEESIRGVYISFENFLEKLRLETKENFMKVKYGVIQSGTKLELNSNIGNFDKDKSIEFIEIKNLILNQKSIMEIIFHS